MHGLETIIKMNNTTDGMSVGNDVKFVVYRERTWFDPNTDQRLWDHLTRAYSDNLEIQLVDSWDEIVFPEGYTKILVDGKGENPLIDFVHPDKAVYIFGRTAFELYDEIPSTEYDISLNVPTPNSIALFGAVAGGIVLHDRYVKSIN